jgi:hypothetical protein
MTVWRVDIFTAGRRTAGSRRDGRFRRGPRSLVSGLYNVWSLVTVWRGAWVPGGGFCNGWSTVGCVTRELACLVVDFQLDGLPLAVWRESLGV